MVIVVGNALALHAGGTKHVDGPAVLAAQIIKICDVVIGQDHQPGHVVSMAKLARLAISLQRFGKLTQTDETDRKIAQRHRDAFVVLARQQYAVCALVALQRLRKPVLTVIHVP